MQAALYRNRKRRIARQTPNAPILISVLPASGSEDGGTAIVLTGHFFTADATVDINGVACTSVVFVSDTTINCTTPATVPANTPGFEDITVTQATGASTLTLGYRYLSDAPLITSITPDHGPLVGGQAVAILGEFFDPTTGVTIDGDACTSIVVIDEENITCVTPSNLGAGFKDVEVLTPGVGSDQLLLGYEYLPVPSITSLDVACGPLVGGTAVTITGTNFVNENLTVEFDGVPATGIVFQNSTTIDCITPAGSAGSVQVDVSCIAGDAALADGFEYVAVPILTSLDVTCGPLAGGTSITLTGMFNAQDLAVEFDGVAATSVVWVNSTTVTCDTPAGTTGDVDVEVFDCGGSDTLLAAFEYIPVPIVSSLDVVCGPIAGSTAITITGSFFNPANLTVEFDGVTATSIVFVNDTTITCVTPAVSAGDADVTVTHCGGSGTLINGYEFVAEPTITSIDIVIGTENGGTAVVLTGTFHDSITTLEFGGEQASSVVYVNATTVNCVTPDYSGVMGVPITELVNIEIADCGGSGELVNGFTFHHDPEYVSINPTFISECDTPGGIVTITGDYFTNTGDMQVEFGDPGIPVAHTYVSQTSITVTRAAILAAFPGFLDGDLLDVHVLNQYGGATGIDQLTLFAMSWAPTLHVLIGTATNHASSTRHIAAFHEWTNGVLTFTRVWFTDHMHQDLLINASAIESGINLSPCPHVVKQTRLLDGSTLYFVEEHVCSIEEWQKKSMLMTKGHWVFHLGSTYSSVLTLLTT